MSRTPTTLPITGARRSVTAHEAELARVGALPEGRSMTGPTGTYWRRIYEPRGRPFPLWAPFLRAMHAPKVYASKESLPRWAPVRFEENRRSKRDPLLVAMASGKAKTDRVLWLPPDEDRAENLRKHLRRAGVTRPALFASDARNKPIWFHDTRSTHLTWRAVRGDHAAVIQAVARHASFQTTLGYINGATLLKARVGEVFPPLPPELIERTSPNSLAIQAREATSDGAGKVSDPVSVVLASETPKTPRNSRPQRELKTLSKLVVANYR